MTYDYNGSWDSQTGHNAPLFRTSSDRNPDFNIQSSIDYYLDNGVPARKLGLGISNAGRTFNLVDPANNRIGAETNGGCAPGPNTNETGVLGYNEVKLT